MLYVIYRFIKFLQSYQKNVDMAALYQSFFMDIMSLQQLGCQFIQAVQQGEMEKEFLLGMYDNFFTNVFVIGQTSQRVLKESFHKRFSSHASKFINIFGNTLELTSQLLIHELPIQKLQNIFKFLDFNIVFLTPNVI